MYVVLGYSMTRRQMLELDATLRQDIIDRYDNVEYWSQDLIDEFVQNEKIEVKDKE